MSKIEKRVVIDNSSERVFTYVGGPIELPEVGPNLLEVREVHHLIGDLRYANWLYKQTGVYEALDIRLEYEADQHAITSQLRQLDLVMGLSFQPDRICAPRLIFNGDYTYWSQC